MKPNQNIEVFSEIVERNGRAIMEKAMSQVLTIKYDAGNVSSAAKYHTKFLQNVAPVFQALFNLSYEAAGKGRHKPTFVGAALTLFIEAANVHDDIIDQTLIKNKRKTAYGKYGADIAILAGDILLVQAAFALYKECDKLATDQREIITKLTFKALMDISKSAAKEAYMHKKLDASPKEYLEVIRLRASVAELHCRIGAMLGEGSEETIAILGLYGRTYGIVGTVLDEFFDLVDFEKFSARLSNEVLPLPVIYALSEPTLRMDILPLIQDFKIAKDDHASIVRTIMPLKELRRLRIKQYRLVDDTIKQIEKISQNDAVKDLTKLMMVLRELICNLESFTNQILV
jgi:geranylgeranyl pyrophosphate synthase